MSFDKYYPNRKDWRKPYTGSKRFDSSCRNHGGCGHCENTRRYQINKEYERIEEALKDGINTINNDKRKD